MNKLNRKEVLMLVLPALVLVGFGFLLRPNGAPRLVFEKAEVLTLSPSEITFGEKAIKHFPELESVVVVEIKYNAASLYDRYFSGLTWQNLTASGYLVDEKGRQYTGFKVSRRSNQTLKGVAVSNLRYLGHQRYAVTFQFTLTRVPSSAGKVTLQAKVTTDNRWTLPLSIVVRHK